jgi:hypothetical protein
MSIADQTVQYNCYIWSLHLVRTFVGGPTDCRSAAASALHTYTPKQPRSRARSGRLERLVGLLSRNSRAFGYGKRATVSHGKPVVSGTRAVVCAVRSDEIRRHALECLLLHVIFPFCHPQPSVSSGSIMVGCACRILRYAARSSCKNTSNSASCTMTSPPQ